MDGEWVGGWADESAASVGRWSWCQGQDWPLVLADQGRGDVVAAARWWQGAVRDAAVTVPGTIIIYGFWGVSGVLWVWWVSWVWHQKLVDCSLGSLCEEFFLIFFFNYFFWNMNYIFREHQARQNSDSVWVHGEVCPKLVLSSFFLYFLRNHVDKIAQGLKGRVLRKKFVLPIESWFFTFFTFFLFMVLHDVIFNMTATICMWSFYFYFKKFYKIHSVEVLSQDPHQQKEF
jgi:hypothetical protein